VLPWHYDVEMGTAN